MAFYAVYQNGNPLLAVSLVNEEDYTARSQIDLILSTLSIFIITDYRKSLSPVNVEAQIFQHAKKKYWTVLTIQSF